MYISKNKREYSDIIRQVNSKTIQKNDLNEQIPSEENISSKEYLCSKESILNIISKNLMSYIFCFLNKLELHKMKNLKNRKIVQILLGMKIKLKRPPQKYDIIPDGKECSKCKIIYPRPTELYTKDLKFYCRLCRSRLDLKNNPMIGIEHVDKYFYDQEKESLRLLYEKILKVEEKKVELNSSIKEAILIIPTLSSQKLKDFFISSKLGFEEALSILEDMKMDYEIKCYGQKYKETLGIYLYRILPEFKNMINVVKNNLWVESDDCPICINKEFSYRKCKICTITHLNIRYPNGRGPDDSFCIITCYHCKFEEVEWS